MIQEYICVHHYHPCWRLSNDEKTKKKMKKKDEKKNEKNTWDVNLCFFLLHYSDAQDHVPHSDTFFLAHDISCEQPLMTQPQIFLVLPFVWPF